MAQPLSPSPRGDVVQVVVIDTSPQLVKLSAVELGLGDAGCDEPGSG